MLCGKPFINNSKWGVGCLTLFALPFFAVGVGMTWWCAGTALQHSAMQSWVETPAVIKHAELKSDHGESTTYRVIATYDYQFAGRPHTGERVGIHGGSDNIGDFQEDAFRELQQHLGPNKPFRCFVNPERPSEAVLYRDLRGEMMAFDTLFASIFGAVGLGLMTAVILAARRAPVSKIDVPADAPWTSRVDWESGLIPDRSHSGVVTTTIAIVAIYWSIAILPYLWKLPVILAQGHGFWSWWSFAFPLVDVVLIASLVYLMIRQRKFGESTLLLAGTPGVIGGQLAGVVRTHKPVAATDGFRLTLNCLDWVSDGDGRSEKSIWQDEQLVMEPMRGDGAGTAIPVLFAIPFDCRETTRPEQPGDVHWRLDVWAKVPGVDYCAKFDVPVFKTAESRQDFALDEQLVAQISPAPNNDLVLREAGIVKEPLADGVRLVFCMAQHFVIASLLTVGLAVWLSVTWVVHLQAPVMAIVFGLFGLVLLFPVLNFWFYRSVAEASPSGLTIRGGLLGIGRTRVIPVHEIQEFAVTEGMRSGATIWNNIVVVLRNGKKRTVARLVSSTLAQRAVMNELSTALKPPTTNYGAP